MHLLSDFLNDPSVIRYLATMQTRTKWKSKENRMKKEIEIDVVAEQDR